MRPSSLATAALLALGACAPHSEPEGPPPLLTALPRPLSAAETGVAQAANAFAFDLLREVTRELRGDASAFLSPLSVSMALALALNGATGGTYDAMHAALRLEGLTEPELNAGYRDFIRLVRAVDPGVDMRVANSMWARPALPLEPGFTGAGAEFYEAEVRNLDFASPDAVETINSWVSERTNGRIPRLLEQIAADEVLFLINAVYFKGRWRSAFHPADTRVGPFHAADGTVRSAPLMRQESTLRYAQTERYQAAELLYGNGAFAMTVVLPAGGGTPAALLAGLDARGWRELVAGLSEQTVRLTLPRFRLEDTRRLDPDLSALGMGIAFDPDRADFSRIADVRPDRLSISRVEHQTFVEVNEEGTEAAAATSVGVQTTSAPMVHEMTVDRPFLFAIRERFSGAILFLGQINSVGS